MVLVVAVLVVVVLVPGSELLAVFINLEAGREFHAGYIAGVVE